MFEIEPITADAIDLLREWSEKEPEVCRKTFLDNVFELSIADARIVNLGRQAAFERIYLINAAIEERVRARGWLIRCNSNASGWHCAVHAPFDGSQPRDPYVAETGKTRAIALLKAYLKALGVGDARTF